MDKFCRESMISLDKSSRLVGRQVAVERPSRTVERRWSNPKQERPLRQIAQRETLGAARALFLHSDRDYAVEQGTRGFETDTVRPSP
jgi:hypothetical protein